MPPLPVIEPFEHTIAFLKCTEVMSGTGKSTKNNWDKKKGEKWPAGTAATLPFPPLSTTKRLRESNGVLIHPANLLLLPADLQGGDLEPLLHAEALQFASRYHTLSPTYVVTVFLHVAYTHLPHFLLSLSPCIQESCTFNLET